MLGAIDWSNLTHASAFLLGAALATIATLRVMRIVSDFYSGQERRPRRRRSDEEADGT